MLYCSQRVYIASDRPWAKRKDGTMRRVKCEDCGRVYDFDTDDFCPRCGAFTFPKGDRIGTDSSVVRVEEIRESNRKDSFLHAEYFVEKRRRKAAGLDRGADRSRDSQWAPAPGGAKTAKVSDPLPTAAKSASRARKAVSATEGQELRKIIGWLVGIVILASFFLEFLDIMANSGW